MPNVMPAVCPGVVGLAASMAALLLAAGEKGKRYALPYTRIQIHQPVGGASGQATDIEIHAREMLSIISITQDILVKHTGQDRARIEKDTERDYFMSAQEELDYGIIDKVFTK